jgi:hypothetical protein
MNYFVKILSIKLTDQSIISSGAGKIKTIRAGVRLSSLI